MNRICVIANSGINVQLAQFVTALRCRGYQDVVWIYCPDNDQPDNPLGCELVPCEPFWEVEGSQADKPNNPALLKGTIFTDPRWGDGDIVLYADCSDIVFLCHPNRLFSHTQSAHLVWTKKHKMMRLDTRIPPDVQKEFNLEKRHLDNARTYNSGVIMAKICEQSRPFLLEFDRLLHQIPQTGAWFKDGKEKIGDQVALSYILRQMVERGLVGYLDEAYNYNEGGKVKQLKIVDGQLMKGDKRIFVPHASGKCLLPDEIVKLATQETGGLRMAPGYVLVENINSNSESLDSGMMVTGCNVGRVIKSSEKDGFNYGDKVAVSGGPHGDIQVGNVAYYIVKKEQIMVIY